MLASKNNHAIDVVVERLRALHDEIVPVRTGTRDHQKQTADAIAEALARPVVRPGGLDEARQRWETVRRACRRAYEELAELDRLTRELEHAERALETHVAAAPPGLTAGDVLDPSIDREIVLAAYQKALRLLDDTERTPDRWLRRRRRRRLAEAADEQVRTALALFEPRVQRTLTDILMHDGPREAIAGIAVALRAVDLRAGVAEARRALELQPGREAAWQAIHGALRGREKVGLKLLAAAWRERLRRAPPEDRAAASAYAQQLAAARTAVSRNAMPSALAAFPVWAVTSLSAGNNFPLHAGLFDLVVIDEASQSDLASALPLLYRARRAVIVGDPNQLTHITTLLGSRDEQLARDHGLSEEEWAAFAFTATSLSQRPSGPGTVNRCCCATTTARIPTSSTLPIGLSTAAHWWFVPTTTACSRVLRSCGATSRARGNEPRTVVRSESR